MPMLSTTRGFRVERSEGLDHSVVKHPRADVMAQGGVRES